MLMPPLERDIRLDVTWTGLKNACLVDLLGDIAAIAIPQVVSMRCVELSHPRRPARFRVCTSEVLWLFLAQQ